MRHAHKIKLLMKRHQGGRGWTGQCIIPGNGGSVAVERVQLAALIYANKARKMTVQLRNLMTRMTEMKSAS